MAARRFVLAIDQGTTSSRAMLMDKAGRPHAIAQAELPQSYPKPGWVEHDAERIWRDVMAVAVEVMAGAGAETIDSIGITNQRETTVLWDRASGRPIAPAIVWQDRRTSLLCETLRLEGLGPRIQEITGLVIDPYFSATKLAWLLDHVPDGRKRARAGELAFGTIDTFLLSRLTGGKVHATDATNAARTMLFDIRRQVWDEELLARFDIPSALLPEVRDSSGDFGQTAPDVFGRAIPIAGTAGDQQAATFGQAAFSPGMVKATYGTGGFLVLNTGEKPVVSRHRLLSTIAWRIEGKTTYALEGAIFVAGAAVQWLRDGLQTITRAEETETLAAAIKDTGGVYLVPAFAGLGAPYWDAEARGALIGLDRSTGRAEIARAALEAVAYQTRDLLAAVAAEDVPPITSLRVDGGLVANDWAMQFLADMLDLPIERPETIETTALGAAYLAGLRTGFYGSIPEIAENWRCARRFEPNMPAKRRNALYHGWLDAVSRVKSGRA